MQSSKTLIKTQMIIKSLKNRMYIPEKKRKLPYSIYLYNNNMLSYYILWYIMRLDGLFVGSDIYNISARILKLASFFPELYNATSTSRI